VITNKGENIQLGGPPCFCSVLGKTLGFKVEVITKIGTDFPRILKTKLHSLGIKPNYSEDYTTRFELDYRYEPRRISVPTICESIQISEIKNAERLLLCPITNEINDELMTSVESNFLALDPQGLVRNIKFDHKVEPKIWHNPTILRKLDLLKTSSSEHHLITGVTRIKDSLRKLIKNGVKLAVITDGSNGSYVMSGSGYWWIPIYRVNIIDSTGAGDIFIAGLSAYLDEGLEWACSLASASSSAIVETHGPEIECSEKEILERAERINDNIKKLT
jgi:sugar/nucleoside kinase (ribokinase family)